MIDLHSHLDLYPDAKTIAENANSKNLFILCVTTSPRAWFTTKQIFSHLHNIEVALGLHPEILAAKISELDVLISNLKNTSFIGEIGIDGSRQYKQSKNKQIETFEKIVFSCNLLGNKVISIHSRQAEKDVNKILHKYQNIGTPILHWYSGSLDSLYDLLDCGCFFSVNQMMLYSNNGLQILSAIPKDKVLFETDGPFTKCFNKTLLPCEIRELTVFFSQKWNMKEQEVTSFIIENVNRIFKQNHINRKIDLKKLLNN